jgi:hypothetical protein
MPVPTGLLLELAIPAGTTGLLPAPGVAANEGGHVSAPTPAP